jgi:hypothetical protein
MTGMRVGVVRWMTVVGLLVLGGAGTAVGADAAGLAPPEAFGATIDLVKFGYLHWNRASGDAVDPDRDRADFSNSFGEHRGRVSPASLADPGQLSGTVGPEACYAMPGGSVAWESRVPGGGEYVLALRLWKEGSRQQTDASAAYQVAPGDGSWTPLPEVTDIPHVGSNGKLVCYDLRLPEGTRAVRVRVSCPQGRLYLHRALLGKKATGLPASVSRPELHPSLYVTPTSLPALRARLRSGLPRFVYETGLAPEARWYVNTLNRHDPAWAATYGPGSEGHVATSISGAAFYYLLSGDKEYLEAVTRMVAVVEGWPKTGDAALDLSDGTYNVLDRGRITSAIAMAYDWLYSDLPEETRARWRALLHHEATALYLYNELGCEETTSINWDPWVGAGAGMAGLALRGEHRWAKVWVDHARRACTVNLARSQEDFGYFHNGLLKTMDFFACLKTATGEDLFRQNAVRLHRDIEESLVHLEPQMDTYPLFGDTDYGTRDPVEAVLVASQLRDGLAQWLVNHLYCRDETSTRKWANADVSAIAVLAFYDPAVKEEEPATSSRLSVARALDGTDPLFPPSYQYVHLRSGFGRSADVQLALHCGGFSGWHGHPDQASPVLNAYGDELVYDPGKLGAYDSAASAFAKSAKAHSSVFIDGRGQIEYSSPVFQDRAAGEPGKLLHTAFVDHIACDTSVAFRKSGAVAETGRVLRHFIFVRKRDHRDYVLMVDDIQPGDDRPHQYDWLLQTTAQHEVTRPAPGAYLFAGKARLHITIVEPATVSEDVSEQFGVRTLMVHALEPATRGVFIAVLFPTSRDAPDPVLAVRRGPVLTEVTVNGSDRFLFTRDGSPIQWEGGETDGAILALLDGREGPSLCVDATYLRRRGVEEFRASRPVTIALTSALQGAAALETGRASLAIGGRRVSLTAGSTVLE